MAKQYFLGANTGSGFVSLYDSFAADGDFLWILKGGPGCGKSSFMRRIGMAAEATGHDVEYVLCSGDPDSLDGVYIRDLGVAYVDGTAPHVQEARHPGADSNYLNLGAHLDNTALRPHLARLTELTDAYRTKYAEAYAALAEAKALHDQLEAVYHPHVDFGGVNALADKHIKRLLG